MALSIPYSCVLAKDSLSLVFTQSRSSELAKEGSTRLLSHAHSTLLLFSWVIWNSYRTPVPSCMSYSKSTLGDFLTLVDLIGDKEHVSSHAWFLPNVFWNVMFSIVWLWFILWAQRHYPHASFLGLYSTNSFREQSTWMNPYIPVLLSCNDSLLQIPPHDCIYFEVKKNVFLHQSHITQKPINLDSDFSFHWLGAQNEHPYPSCIYLGQWFCLFSHVYKFSKSIH